MCLGTGFSRELFSAQVLSCLRSGTCWRELSFKSGSIPTELLITQLGLVQPSRGFHQDRAVAALAASLVMPWVRDPLVLTDLQKS